ncbi:histone H1-delta-like [Procambarus clarkii]|uniref:histone H1-delta-like n=1 Tax=Procambarus clarkii TaxID=6728 RepID=UPI003744905C
MVVLRSKTKTSDNVLDRTANHPKYSEMVVAAITFLNNSQGSSRQNILKFVVCNFSVNEKDADIHLKLALRRGVTSSALTQVKITGRLMHFKVNKCSDEAKLKASAKKAAGRNFSHENASANNLPEKTARKRHSKKKQYKLVKNSIVEAFLIEQTMTDIRMKRSMGSGGVQQVKSVAATTPQAAAGSQPQAFTQPSLHHMDQDSFLNSLGLIPRKT